MKRRKHWKRALFVLLVLAVLGSGAAVYADASTPPEWDDLSGLGGPALPEGPPDQGQSRHPHPARGLRGAVTAVSEAGLTVLTRQEVLVQVHVNEETVVWFVETQSKGALSDIEVGDRVFVQGRRAPGDEVHGRVATVEGSVITLAIRRPEDPGGTFTVVTDDDTEYRVGREQGSLDDVTEGKLLAAFGELQADGSLLARLVIVDNRPPPPPRVHNLRGEVTAVSTAGLTLLTRSEISVQVNVSEDTKVWLVETQSQGTLADVAAGDRVLVRGTRAEDGEPENPVLDARAIVVAPDGDEAHGRVKGVAGSTIALAFREPDDSEGEATVITDDSTEFRLQRQRGGWREGSLGDVAEGRFVVAFGETQFDGSLLARLVFVHRGPRNHPQKPPS